MSHYGFEMGADIRSTYGTYLAPIPRETQTREKSKPSDKPVLKVNSDGTASN